MNNWFLYGTQHWAEMGEAKCSHTKTFQGFFFQPKVIGWNLYKGLDISG